MPVSCFTKKLFILENCGRFVGQETIVDNLVLSNPFKQKGLANPGVDFNKSIARSQRKRKLIKSFVETNILIEEKVLK